MDPMSYNGWSNWYKVCDFLLWLFNSPTMPFHAQEQPGCAAHGRRPRVSLRHSGAPASVNLPPGEGTLRLASFLLLAERPAGFGVSQAWVPAPAWPL